MKDSIEKSKQDFIKFKDSCEIFKTDMGRIVMLECEEGVEILDMVAGLDNVSMQNKHSIKGIAFRSTNMTDYSPNFTIRYSIGTSTDTEYKKRAFAICNNDQGYLYPWYTLQLWKKDEKHVVALLARTCDVLQDLSSNHKKIGNVCFKHTTTVKNDKSINNLKESHPYARIYLSRKGIWEVHGASMEKLNKPIELDATDKALLKGNLSW